MYPRRARIHRHIPMGNLILLHPRWTGLNMMYNGHARGRLCMAHIDRTTVPRDNDWRNNRDDNQYIDDIECHPALRYRDVHIDTMSACHQNSPSYKYNVWPLWRGGNPIPRPQMYKPGPNVNHYPDPNRNSVYHPRDNNVLRRNPCICYLPNNIPDHTLRPTLVKPAKPKQPPKTRQFF